MKEFITIKAKVPKFMNFIFHPDGTQTVECGEEVEKELIVHILPKEPKTTETTNE